MSSQKGAGAAVTETTANQDNNEAGGQRGQLAPPAQADSEGEDDLQAEGIITTFPDELLLLIFCYLESRDLVSSISKVSKKWRQLACEPILWKNRFIYYDPRNPDDFIEHMHNAHNQIRHLHLGGHIALEERAMQALLATDDVNVKKFDFFGSCRTSPSIVIKVLTKFSSSIESLSICLNDELVSYGKDGKTCYCIPPSKARRGLLITLIGNMQNLTYLKLRGGFKTNWYFGEFLEETCIGCNKLEVLDVKDFEEVYENFTSFRKLDFIQSLILRNKDHLKSLKMSETFDFDVTKWVKSCQLTLKELSIHMEHLLCLSNPLFHLTCLEISGKQERDDWNSQIGVFNGYTHITEVLKEFNLIYLQEHYLHSIFSLSFRNLRVLRLDGNLLNGTNIEVILNHLPILAKLCVRESYIVAGKHLISMKLMASSLRSFDFEHLHDLNCISTEKKLQHVPIGKLKVYQTGCVCKNMSQFKTKGDTCEQGGRSYARNKVLSAGISTPDDDDQDKIIHFTLSRTLRQEFLPEFWDFEDNDITFHFGK